MAAPDWAGARQEQNNIVITTGAIRTSKLLFFIIIPFTEEKCRWGPVIMMKLTTGATDVK